MPAVVIRNLSPETHAALKRRAKKRGVSTSAEIRAILDEAAQKSQPFVSLYDVFKDTPKEVAEIEWELPERRPWKPREIDLS